MDARVTARVKDWLVNVLHRQPHECGSIFFNIQELARKAGYDVDERFARAGLAAGPESRVASALVEHALVGGGVNGTTLAAIQQQVDRWLERTHLIGK